MAGNNPGHFIQAFHLESSMPNRLKIPEFTNRMHTPSAIGKH
jgi:hypothetical protein